MAEITNSLLKQAIADAEAVRETAVANAKLVLEEAITPQIRDMIARRLRVEAEHTDAEDVEKDSDKEDVVDEGTAPETPHEDGKAVGGKDMPADSSEVGGGENKQPSDDSFDSSDVGNGPENAGDSDDDWYDDWSESDFDLTEVIRELEEDIAALSDGASMYEADEDEDELTQTHPHAHARAGLKRDATNADKPVEAPVGDSDDEDDDEELDLESILAELEAEEDGDEDEESTDEGADAHAEDPEKEEMATELARLQGELAQWKEALATVRERLHEVNLLNAKLLFTNKMFRKEGLSNEQKVRIVESFDRATTVREVKLVYTALVENLSTAAKSYGASRKKVVVEGLASKASPTTAPKSQETIVENSVAKRLKELAGLI
jgi:hypothetical protein